MVSGACLYLFSMGFGMAFGSSGRVSFCFFPYIGFVCTGYGLGMVIKKVEHKEIFFKKGSMIAGMIVIAAAVLFFAAYPMLDEQCNALAKAYLVADIAKLIVSDSVIFLLLAFFFFFRNTLEKSKWLTQKIRTISKHISKYYTIHIGVYSFCLLLTGYNQIGVLGCILFFFPVMFATDYIVKTICIKEKIAARIR